MDRKEDLINISLFLSEIISDSDLDFYRFLDYGKWNIKLYFNLSFFQHSASITFSETYCLLPCVQTSKFCCIASAAWLGKVIFTKKEPALPKWIMNPSIYMGIVLIHTWKITWTFITKQVEKINTDKLKRKKKKNLKQPFANRFSIFNVGAELCNCLIKQKGKSV